MKGDSGSPSPWKWKGVRSNFQRKEDNGFSLPSIFEGNRQKGKQVAVVEAGGGVGVGCGVGLGFGVVGGAGHGAWAWNHLHLVFGVGLGCGVGLGLGIGQGIGYGFSFDSLDIYFSDEKPNSRDRNLFQI